MKERLTQKQFDRKIKIWSVIISPVLVALIGALTTVSVSYFSSTPKKKTQITEVEYRITERDSLDIEILSAQIDTLKKRFYNTNDDIEQDTLNAALIILAKREANIYRKYFPSYEPRWPPFAMSESPPGSHVFSVIIILIPFLILGVMFAIRPVVRKIFRDKYKIVQ